MTILALYSPVGIAIGLMINSASRMAAAIILSFDVGTFIYISCSEILMLEFADNKHLILKFASFMLGGGLICGLWFLMEDH